jgi:hypothetical protein
MFGRRNGKRGGENSSMALPSSLHGENLGSNAPFPLAVKRKKVNGSQKGGKKTESRGK